MELQRVLEQMAEILEAARGVPMSTSCVVSRPELQGLVKEALELLPRDLREADRLLAEREALLTTARDEAFSLVRQGRAERDRLVGQHEVHVAALTAAAEVRRAAEEEARALRAEVDDYVDAKLAHFEVALTRTLETITTGRERLRPQVEPDPEADAEPVLAGDEQG